MRSFTKLILRSVLVVLLCGAGSWQAAAQIVRGTFAAGANHALSIHADGTLWATGNNAYGQLGNGTTTNQTAWTQIGTDTDWVQVAAGQNFSLGLRANGTAYAWGLNNDGQLGDGTTTDRTQPTALAGNTTYSQLSAGLFHALGLSTDGTVYAWGLNDNGQLGDGTTANHLIPTAISGAGTYTQVEAGFYHSLGLRADGTAWAWGRNNNGQLGNSTVIGRTIPTAVVGGYVFTQLSAGGYFSLGLRDNGTALAWGDNSQGQLGDGSSSYKTSPVAVVGSEVYSQVATGSFHSLALRADGTLRTWGYNAQGQLGTNTITSRAEPGNVLNIGTCVQAVAGSNFTLGLRADGTLWVWGDNVQGQLGLADTNPHAQPVVSGQALPTRSIAAGAAFGLAIRGDGTLWTWGDNAYGQLGDGTTTDHARPAPATTDQDWVQVMAGENYALALKANGSLWAWGRNDAGQLGLLTTAGTATITAVPTLVSSGPYVRLAAGQAHSLALKADGTLWAWGANTVGQLGSQPSGGLLAVNASPAQVPGLYKQVVAGASHTLALRATGLVYAWGSNEFGQLGSAANAGTPTANPTPAAVGPDAYARLAAGQAHSLALRADGSLWAWGSNEFGQLGSTANLGTATPNPVPSQVPGLYTKVTAGYAYSQARNGNGALYAWGADNSGQLGLGTTSTAVPTPTQEATRATTWTTLAPGPLSRFSLVRTPSAQNFASAGLNDQAQLGDGTTTNASRFDRVNPLQVAQPLPVVLVSFAAQRTGPATVALAWATASETNNVGFTVEKSVDGVAFAALGFVAGAGTSAGAHTYAFTDAQAPGLSYYRLAQQDADGTVTYSPVEVVAGTATSLVLAPNPATGPVQVLGLPPEATLVVYDELGRTVRPAATTLNVAGLPAGVYVVRATAPSQAPQTARLVVQ